MPPKHQPPDCSQAETINRIEQALFRGNGKPSILAQLEVGNEKFNEIDRKLETIMSTGRAIVLAIFGLIGTTLWNMIIQHGGDTFEVNNKQAEVR